MSFGERLRCLREHFNLPQWQVAEDIGVSEVTVSHAEKHGVIGVELLRRMAVYYQYDFEILSREMEILNGRKPGSSGRNKTRPIPKDAPRTASERVKIYYSEKHDRKGENNADYRKRDHKD